MVYYVATIEDSLTVCTVNHPGSVFFEKMMRIIKCRCHLLILDCNINSVFIVRVNIFQLFLFTAIKFHCYVKYLPQKPEKNPSFFLRNFSSNSFLLYSKRLNLGTIINIIHGTCDWIQKVIHSPIAKKMQCSCPIPSIEIRWFEKTTKLYYSHFFVGRLGLVAFHRILNKKQTKYQSIIHALKEKKTRPQFQRAAKNTEDVINPIYSQIFESVEF